MSPDSGGAREQSGSRWRVSVAVGEGLRNWRHGRWLTWAATILITAAFAVPAIVDGVGVSRLVAAERAWEAAGGRVLVATNDNAGGVPRAACEAASRIDGIAASASLTRLTARAGLVNAPDADLPVVAAGAGVSGLLGAHGGGAILPPDIADTLRVTAGNAIWVSGTTTRAADGPPILTDAAADIPTGRVTVGVVTDTTLLGERYAYALLLPATATGLAEACFVRAEPGHLDAARDALPTLLASGGQDAVVADRLISGDYVRDYATEYRQRGLKDAPWAVGAATALLWLLLVWVRRSRDGLYTTLGADGPTRAVIRTTEGLALVGSSTLAAGTVAFGVLTIAGADLTAVAGGTGRHLAIATTVAIIGVVASAGLPFGTPLAALKDR